MPPRCCGTHRMKQHAILVVTSLLSNLLLTLHVTDDIVRGILKAEPANSALLVLVVFLYGTLVLAERRSGHVIMLLVGLFAAGMPVIHMRGHTTARSPSPPAASSSSGHSGRLAGSAASPSSCRRADCGACDAGTNMFCAVHDLPDIHVRLPSPRTVSNRPAQTRTAPTIRATRSPDGARRSSVIAAATASIARRSMTPTTSRITIRPLQH